MEKETLTSQLETIGEQILMVSRNELYLKMRFMDVALSGYAFVMDVGLETIGTDGLAIYYHPQYLGGLFREDRILVNRIYLHMVLHGIFRHMLRRQGREDRLYNLSCDIAVESIIDGMNYRCVLRSRSYIRRQMYADLKRQMKVLTAEKIYQFLDAQGLKLSWNGWSVIFVWTAINIGRRMTRRSVRRLRISGRVSANRWRRTWRHFPRRHLQNQEVLWIRSG